MAKSRWLKFKKAIIESRHKVYPSLTEVIDGLGVADTGFPEKRRVYMEGHITYLNGEPILPALQSIRHVSRGRAKDVVRQAKKLEGE